MNPTTISYDFPADPAVAAERLRYLGRTITRAVERLWKLNDAFARSVERDGALRAYESRNEYDLRELAAGEIWTALWNERADAHRVSGEWDETPLGETLDDYETDWAFFTKARLRMTAHALSGVSATSSNPSANAVAIARHNALLEVVREIGETLGTPVGEEVAR